MEDLKDCITFQKENKTKKVFNLNMVESISVRYNLFNISIQFSLRLKCYAIFLLVYKFMYFSVWI